MKIEIWYKIINWFADFGILISALVSLLLTILIKLDILNLKLRLQIIMSIIYLTILLSLNYFLIQLIWPYTFIPLITIFVCYFFVNKINLTNNKVIALYAFVSLLLIFAFELAKVSYNTWGSGTRFAGVFMIVYILPLFQLIRQLSQHDKIYGYTKLIVGLTLIILVLVKRFNISEYDGETVFLIRKSLILMSIVFFIEGTMVVLRRNHFKIIG